MPWPFHPSSHPEVWQLTAAPQRPVQPFTANQLPHNTPHSYSHDSLLIRSNANVSVYKFSIFSPNCNPNLANSEQIVAIG